MRSGNNHIYKIKSLPFNRTKLVRHLKERLSVDKIEEDVDILIYLDFMIFLERLAKKSEERASEDVVRQRDIEDSLTDVLREFRG